MNHTPEDSKLVRSKKAVSFFHSPFAAWSILFLSLILTLSAYYVSQNFIYKKAKVRFDFRCKEILFAVQERMLGYEQVLRGGVSFFNAKGVPSRKEFENYVSTLSIAEYWPGIQGIGFSIPVNPDEKEAHIANIRSEGFNTYTINPPGERDLYSAIIYLEPFDWRNQRAFGYDMWSNEMRRQAMKRARDDGIPSTSGLITLVQETKTDIQKGFLTYLPVYKNRETPLSLTDKRKQFIGWVYAAFRMNDLMRGTLGSIDSDIDFEIYDGFKVNQDNLLFSTNDGPNAQPLHTETEFNNQNNIKLQGRDWTIKFSSKPNYIKPSDTQQANIVLIIGAIIDLLLFYVIYSIYFLQKRAESIAKEMTLELRENEAELVKSKVLAEKANESKSMFLANISHELRTPLNSIVVLSELMAKNKKGNLSADHVKFSKTINSCGKDLTYLIDDILDISKAESGKIILNKENFYSKEIISILQDEFEQMAKEKGIGLHITMDSSFPETVHHDFIRIHQILKNLFSNALKFTKEGSIHAHFFRPKEEIHFKNSNLSFKNCLAFSVTDTGIGIPTSKFEEIFEDFNQADGSTTRDYAGTGLGLSISKKLSEVLGGEIHLKSIEGEGSTFTLYLDEDLNIESPLATEIKPNNNISKSNVFSKLSGKSFLIVDDKRENILSLAAIFIEHGVNISEAYDGQQAITAMKNETFDLVLMDMMMPVMGGLEAIEAIRKMNNNRRTPIIVITAKAMPEDKEICLSTGADDYISKPIDTDKLMQKIEKIFV